MSETPIRVVNQTAGPDPGSADSVPLPGNDTIVNTGLDVDIPISSYMDATGYPYSVEHFDLGLYWDDPLFKDIRIELMTVENYVKDKMAELGLTDTKEAYLEVIESVLDMITAYENEKPLERLHRLAVTMRAITEMESAKIEPVLSVNNLQPEDYEDIYG
jgi:hypothetical protein